MVLLASTKVVAWVKFFKLDDSTGFEKINARVACAVPK